MTTYLDIHDVPGVKARDVVAAHEADVRVQAQYGVNYKRYWVDEDEGKVFCLVEAPDRESAGRRSMLVRSKICSDTAEAVQSIHSSWDQPRPSTRA